MGKPIIAYNNIMPDYATIAATSTATDYFAESVADWKPYTWWAPSSTGTNNIDVTFSSSKNANYVGIFSHNLEETGATVDIQYHTGAAWANLVTGLSASNSQVIFRTFGTVSSDQFRIKVNNAALDTYLGVVAIGTYIEIPVGIPAGSEPPHLAYNDRLVNNTSESGILIGTSVIAESLKTTIKFKFLSPSWVRNTFVPMMEQIRENPFIFAADYENYPDEAIFCKIDGRLSAPTYDTSIFMSAQLNVIAWHKQRTWN